MTEINYYVDFLADFHRPRSFDEPAGEELADILAEGLPAHGIGIASVNPGDDFRCYIQCVAGTSTIELAVGPEILDEQHNRWYVQTCAKQSFFGQKNHPEADCLTLLSAVDAVLRDCDRVSNIRWFPGFDTPEYLALIPPSRGPLRDAGFEERLHPLIRFEWKLGHIVGAIYGLRGMALAFMLICIVGGFAPHFMMPVAITWVMLLFALAIVAPQVTCTLIRRAARRVLANRR